MFASAQIACSNHSQLSMSRRLEVHLRPIVVLCVQMPRTADSDESESEPDPEDAPEPNSVSKSVCSSLYTSLKPHKCNCTHRIC